MPGRSVAKKDVHDLLEQAVIYTKEERERVERIIYAQMRKYAFFFEEE